MNNLSTSTRLHWLLLAAILLCLPLLTSCAINAFDKGQVPVIGVKQEGGTLKINWSPQNAWHVRVLEGVVDPKDPKNTRPPSQGVMWSISKETKSVTSPVTYGQGQDGTWASDVKPLVPGKTYTVYVLREDLKGSGGGFTNTHNTYEATAVFVAE